MSKAVLVMDRMPEGCVECTLAWMNADGRMVCTATEKEANFIIGVDKPGSCPLRLLPDAVTVHKGDENTTKIWAAGWNMCLKEIEG